MYTVSVGVSANIEIVCKICGEDLSLDANGKEDWIEIPPCTSCMKELEDNSYNDGWSTGQAELEK